MENKKGKLILMIIAIVIVIALILTVFFDVFKIDTKTKKEETETKEETKEFSYMPLTYKVCDEDSCVYITGSIHLGDKRITKIDEKLMKIFEECDYLALEVHDDAELDTSSFMLKNGQTIKDLVSPDLYAKMEKFEEDHPMFILKTLNNFTPAYMYDYIDLLPYIENKYTREGVDSFFESKAEKANKEILAFETTEFQMNILFGYSNEFYFSQIEDTIDNYEEVEKDALEMYEAYLSGDEERIKAAIDLELEEGEELTEEEQHFFDAIFTNRNVHMTEVIEEYLRDNKEVFVVVGEAHVVPKDGIIDALTQTGNYKIEVVK